MKKDDLISRAALLDEFHSLCGPQTGDGWDNMGVRNLIVRQKAVDAITMEWLRGMMLECEAEESRAAWVVMREWRKWKQEQEAR